MPVVQGEEAEEVEPTAVGSDRETVSVTRRVRDAAGWVRWHQVELAAVTLPTMAAVAVSPWWATVTAVAASRWWWCERHAHRDSERDTAERDKCDEPLAAS